MVKYATPLSVKASGGIKGKADFDSMIALGVKRIRISSALNILQ